MDGITESQLVDAFCAVLRPLNVHAHRQQAVQPVDFQRALFNANRGFGLRGQAQFQFISKGVPVAPIPLTIVGWPVHVVLWGLNPRFSEDTASDKQVATGGTWTDYAAFYIGTHQAPAFFQYAFSGHGHYYPTLAMVMATLKDPVTGPTTPTGHVVRKLHDYLGAHAVAQTPAMKNAAAFWTMAHDFGVMTLEFIPFHSPRTIAVTKQNPATLQALGYHAYHQQLVALMEQVVAPKGWIVANGADAVAALRAQLGPALVIDKTTPQYALGTWKGRSVTLLRTFWKTAKGWPNSDADFRTWLEQIW